MDIADLLSKWCDHFTDVMLDNPGDPHCPACAALEEIADLENELQRLRAQVTALLPWAFSYLGYRSFANALGDEGEDLLDRIRAGEFSDRLSPPFRKWSDEENAVTDALIEQATPFDVSGYEAL